MSNLIYREYQGQTFTFREDGYFNMTKAAATFGKEAKEFLRLPSTIQYMEAMENVGFSHLYEIKRGRNGGTWGHPKLAVFFARWLDPKFAVFCDAVIDDILNKKAELNITKPEQSMTMQVPQSFPEALRLAAELAEQAAKLEAENKEMSDELNLVTLDEYRALTHRYFDRSYTMRLAFMAKKLLEEVGITVESQHRVYMTKEGPVDTEVKVYPRHILEQAEQKLSA
ncbi:KilA-N domain-containing protein [Oceanisphaera psychrotolerans]|uniref:KilA-N domain-containing protein n=1 Tax=Oceanisphaera psychrotolerans TaxID=1414654 RepID=A0A1J4QFA3_9GAMM|nr:KilA-N domain-containing protein [Oceanisphaera psychrotolerans]OIN07927.1 hypothetical protein BFR47_16040 [Oceanisphaera psychrotolerans]